MSSRKWGSAAALVVAFVAVASAAVPHFRERARGPLLVVHKTSASQRSLVNGVAHIVTTLAPDGLVADTVLPREPVSVIWLEGRVASRTINASLVLDSLGGVVRIDSMLVATRVPVRGSGREWISVAAGPAGGTWLTDATGDLFLADSLGALTAEARTPFAFAEVASDASNPGIAWYVRSRHRFGYGDPPTPSPVVVRRGVGSAATATLGQALRPEHILLADLANAGSLAIVGQTLVYAPFIRDEVTALTTTGDTLWTSSRALGYSTMEPRFELAGGKPVVAYHPVNLGVTVGTDGLVYVLSTASEMAMTSRLDVFDPATGNLVRTATLPTATPTLALGRRGRLYALNPATLLASLAVAHREMVPALDFPKLRGGRFTLQALRGRVVLVNLWASWCGPCAAEMPALDSMQRGIRDSAFAFIGISDDRDAASAERFMHDRRFTFTVASAGGTALELLHAQGLPTTLLVDAEGREVQRWNGYGGPAQIEEIDRVLRRELALLHSSTEAHHHAMR